MEVLAILVLGLIASVVPFRSQEPAARGGDAGRDHEPRRRTHQRARRRVALARHQRQREERMHARRIAWLESVRESGEAEGDEMLLARAARLIRAEQTRHEERLRRLESEPQAS